VRNNASGLRSGTCAAFGGQGILLEATHALAVSVEADLIPSRNSKCANIILAVAVLSL
jgi:hypothetical protein